MSVEVTMPQMGADMTEGTLLRWLKHVGDQINRGDVLAEIETDKATVELEAFEAGVLRKLCVEEGETVPVGEVVAILGTADEPMPADVERKPPAETPARRTIEQPAAAPAGRSVTAELPSGPPTTPRPPEEVSAPPRDLEDAPERISPPGDGRAAPSGEAQEGRLRVSPVARRIAEEAGVDLAAVRGTGPDGRILRRDVEATIGRVEPPVEPEPARQREPAAPARQEPAASGTEPLSRMRQAIARRMTQSKQTQPHYYLTLDVDMTAALSFREQLNAAASEEQRVSINDLIVKACALALERHRKFNAAYTDQGLQFHDSVNVSIGVALEEGLIAPAVLDCQQKTLGRIAAETKDLVNRAKGGRLSAEEYASGTFTITNLGAYGVETLIGIINPPQAAILGVGSVMPQAVVRDGAVVARQMMKVALSADHRVSDGAEGARFIKEIQALLENPASLAL